MPDQDVTELLRRSKKQLLDCGSLDEVSQSFVNDMRDHVARVFENGGEMQ